MCVCTPCASCLFILPKVERGEERRELGIRTSKNGGRERERERKFQSDFDFAGMSYRPVLELKPLLNNST